MTATIHQAPLALHSERVLSEWVDYNGHMNLSYYVLAFDHATDAFLDYIGMDEAYREREQGSVFTLEIHVNYLRELMEGDPLRCTTQLLDYDAKRIHYFHCMYHAERGYLAATNELIVLHMDMRERRASAMPPAVVQRLGEIMTSHRALARPQQAGRVIGIRRKA